jgi:hypothetical protein
MYTGLFALILNIVVASVAQVLLGSRFGAKPLAPVA